MKVELGLVMVVVGIIFTHLNNHLIVVVDAISVSSVVTPSFFNSIINQTPSSCKGKNFYTRAGFLNATKSFPKFGTGSSTAAKREIAAFFAHATHETGHFCYIDEIGASTKPYCDHSCPYKCKAKSYHGRGPIQLTWNCNYGACGHSLGLDLLNNPELASTNPSVSFNTALWYWDTRVRSKMTSNGFGATIRAINGGECRGGNPNAVANRVKYYKAYCKTFRVSPGDNVSC